MPTDGLALPRTDVRELVRGPDRTYQLRGSQTQTLATVGTFRVVPVTDLGEGRSARDVSHGDLRHLDAQGLLDRTTVVINHRATLVAVLTRDGKALLEAHQYARPGGRSGITRGWSSPASWLMTRSCIASFRRRRHGSRPRADA